MKFDTPATRNPIDRLKVVGHATERIDGPRKTTGTTTYAHEHDAAGAAHGWIAGAAIAKGRIGAIDTRAARAAPGVLGVVTAANAGQLGTGAFFVARALAGPQVDHYHQAVAIVVAETFEQARAAAGLLRVDYVRGDGSFDLAGYEVPVHADIPHMDVVFLDEVDATAGPLKAKGVGELGINGVPAAIANAVYHATGIRVRDYPITLDKLLHRLPPA